MGNKLERTIRRLTRTAEKQGNKPALEILGEHFISNADTLEQIERASALISQEAEKIAAKAAAVIAHSEVSEESHKPLESEVLSDSEMPRAPHQPLVSQSTADVDLTDSVATSAGNTGLSDDEGSGRHFFRDSESEESLPNLGNKFLHDLEMQILALPREQLLKRAFDSCYLLMKINHANTINDLFIGTKELIICPDIDPTVSNNGVVSLNIFTLGDLGSGELMKIVFDFKNKEVTSQNDQHLARFVALTLLLEQKIKFPEVA